MLRVNEVLASQTILFIPAIVFIFWTMHVVFGYPM